MMTIEPHPLLEVAVFHTAFNAPLGELETPAAIIEWLALGAGAPLTNDDACRKAIRDLLRHGGYKPTGRGKPASEYLLGAAAEEPLASINLAVDACNAVSLHSGLPISVIDLDRARGPLRIGIAGAGSSYVFNASGQSIDLAGLVCLFDGEGPCANAVKDAQRTKTLASTIRTCSVVWGTRALPGRTARALEWYRSLLESAGAHTELAS